MSQRGSGILLIPFYTSSNSSVGKGGENKHTHTSNFPTYWLACHSPGQYPQKYDNEVVCATLKEWVHFPGSQPREKQEESKHSCAYFSLLRRFRGLDSLHLGGGQIRDQTKDPLGWLVLYRPCSGPLQAFANKNLSLFGHKTKRNMGMTKDKNQSNFIITGICLIQSSSLTSSI